jgi:hypothetical protein
MLYSTIQNLASNNGQPCVTISLNTHRTHPDNVQDSVNLKNLCKEAEERLLNEFDKRSILPLLSNLEAIQKEIDVNYNLDSLHVFLSNDIKEVVRSSWRIDADSVQISEKFALRGVINAYNRSKEYGILLVSQSGVQFYDAMDDAIVEEIKNEDFPFSENPIYTTNKEEISDAKRLDNKLLEFLNRVDKAVVKYYNLNELPVVVVSVADTFHKLMEVADRPRIYLGHVNVNYNDTATHTLAKSAWELVKDLQFAKRTDAIKELAASVSKGNVLTDLQEIYRAAKEGRGDLLIVNENFSQPVLLKENNGLELINDVTVKDAVDDVVSEIAWEVLSKKGRTVFTSQEDLDRFGQIALKVRW